MYVFNDGFFSFRKITSVRQHLREQEREREREQIAHKQLRLSIYPLLPLACTRQTRQGPRRIEGESSTSSLLPLLLLPLLFSPFLHRRTDTKKKKRKFGGRNAYKPVGQIWPQVNHGISCSSHRRGGYLASNPENEKGMDLFWPRETRKSAVTLLPLLFLFFLFALHLPSSTSPQLPLPPPLFLAPFD